MERVNEFSKIYKSKEYKEKIPEFPYILDIELTNHCNLNCKMCSRSLMERDMGYISEEIFKRTIDEASNYGTGIRFIRWGEPFLHPKILDYIKYVKDKGLPLHITTNGLLLDEEKMQKLIDLKVDSIIFSMQGASKKEYENMRNNKMWDVLIYNITSLIKKRGLNDKPYIHITTTITENDTSSDVEGFKSYFNEVIGVDKVSVGRTSLARLGGPKGAYIHCREPYQKLGVDWDGTVTACCSDYDNFLPIGNVMTNTIYFMWNYGTTLKSIRNLLSFDKNRSLTLCSKCYPAYGNLNDNTS